MTKSNPFLRGFALLALMLSISLSSRVMAATTIIDILLVYDTSAAAWVRDNSGMAAFSADVVNRMNQAVENSGIDLRFRMVKAMEVVYTTTAGPFTPPSDDLEALREGSGAFAAVHAARDQHAADLVAMLIDTGYSFGATGAGCALFQWEGYDGCAFSVNAIQSVAISHTLTHEVGHNLGADHAKSQVDSPGPNGWLDGQYSAGWYFTGTNGIAYHTVMAYDDDGRGNRYQEAPLFSTPLRNHQGTVAGDAEDGDNSRLIRETMGVVAAYRSSASPVTLTLSVTSTGASALTIGASPATYGGTTNYVKTGISMGTRIELTAPTSAGTGDFINWMGCDTVAGTRCEITMSSDKTVTANYPSAATMLTNGQEVSDISGVGGSQRYYVVEVGSGISNLVIETWGGTGDADLYVKRGQIPTPTNYDCRPFAYGNEEICTFPNPDPGKYQVMLNAATDFSGLSLKASLTERTIPLIDIAEFHNTTLNHYFITNPSEAAMIDGGSAGPGWYRTGLTFQEADVSTPGYTPICRFYTIGANSHFYAAQGGGECESLKAANPGNILHPDLWTYEGITFHAIMPLDGRCPENTKPVYRLYNNRYVQRDSNHRYTTDSSVCDFMVAQGWVMESGVAMCTPMP